MNGNGIRGFGKMGRYILLVCALVVGCQIHCQAQLSDSALIAVQAAAEADDPAAQDTLAGEFIRHGYFLQAELWYRQAAKQGDANAQAKLGQMLLTHAGLNVAQKSNIMAAIDSEAINWLTLAANESNTLAQAELAIINNHTFGAGDTGVLKVAGKLVQVHCLEIGDMSALVQITGLDRPKVLIMADDTIKN